MKNPDGYHEYIKSAQWRNISALVKKLAGYKCQRCGFASATLHAHHKTYERFGKERLTDLECVCERCHPQADADRVAEGTARGLASRDAKAIETYKTKRFGEGHELEDNPNHDEVAEEWLERKRDEEMDS